MLQTNLHEKDGVSQPDFISKTSVASIKKNRRKQQVQITGFLFIFYLWQNIRQTDLTLNMVNGKNKEDDDRQQIAK